MSLIIIKIVGSLIMAISGFFMLRNLIGNDEKILNFYNLMSIILIVIPIFILYEKKYSLLLTVCIYLAAIFAYKRIFKMTLEKSVLSTSAFMIFTGLIDALLSTIEPYFFSYEQVRLIPEISILNNILIGTLAILITDIKYVQLKFREFCNKVDTDESLSKIIFVILSVLIVAVLYYNITNIFKLNLTYTITIISIVIFFILYYFYIVQYNKYEKLNNEYNFLFDYVQNFENWIDDEQMYRHELKNNLSMIRNMTKNKKIINKIDEMLKFSIIIDEQAIEDLKNIPKGGLKGLLYYKVALAKNKNVKLIIEVSPKVNTLLKKISEKHLRQLCIVLGIYLDNALEAAEISKKKTVTLEVYELNKVINFAISNTYKELLPLKTMKKKGFTTKGNNRGKGLYFVNKIINKTKWLKSEQIFLNDYFIQKISIK